MIRLETGGKVGVLTSHQIGEIIVSPWRCRKCKASRMKYLGYTPLGNAALLCLCCGTKQEGTCQYRQSVLTNSEQCPWCRGKFKDRAALGIHKGWCPKRPGGSPRRRATRRRQRA